MVAAAQQRHSFCMRINGFSHLAFPNWHKAATLWISREGDPERRCVKRAIPASYGGGVMRSKGAVRIERRARPAPASATTDSLRLAVFLFHAAIVGYVVSGWTSDEADALLAYVIL